ncbi:MAG: sirohydrochlorin nickelochelatase [Candidatus Bathyarchaeota archaeon]|nr:sirohydrochlorin nickelochelatase [Candidatus Bathyarchaeota archaeon]
MDDTGLVVIGHGSKLPQSRENLEAIAAMLRKRSSFKCVELAFMVRNTPTIPQAIDAIAKRGIKKIVLIPAFLAPGVHTQKDIPELIGVKDKESHFTDKGIQLLYGEPLGADERIADIIEEKALAALGAEPATASVYGAGMPASSRKIYEKSMSLIRPQIQDVLSTAPKNQAPIIERVVHTTADPQFAKLLRITETAVDSGVAAIKAGAKVVTDVKMIQAGINEKRLKRFGGAKILNYVGDARAVTMAHSEGITRAAAAMRLAAADGLDGAVVLIGNAPTAAFELARLVKEGKAKPALIVAVPVGYVDATESKDEISTLDVPHIIVKGKKGGSPIAVSVFNALLAMAEEAN